MMRNHLSRAVEIMLGLVLLTLAGAVAWIIHDVVSHPNPSRAAGMGFWAATYATGFAVLVAIVFGLRLILPRMRADGGRIVGRRATAIAGCLYLAGLTFQVWRGDPDAQRSALAIGFGAALALALMATFRGRRGRE